MNLIADSALPLFAAEAINIDAIMIAGITIKMIPKIKNIIEKMSLVSSFLRCFMEIIRSIRPQIITAGPMIKDNGIKAKTVAITSPIFASSVKNTLDAGIYKATKYIMPTMPNNVATTCTNVAKIDLFFISNPPNRDKLIYFLKYDINVIVTKVPLRYKNANSI